MVRWWRCRRWDESICAAARPADLELSAQLWQGQQDWAVFQPDETGVSGKLLRHDLGRLLWTSTPTGELQRLLPPVPKPGQEPTLSLSYDRFDATTADGQQRLGDLVLQVRNSGGSPAYWVEVEPVDNPELLDLKRAIRLKRPDNIEMRIGSNKELELRLQIWDRKKPDFVSSCATHTAAAPSSSARRVHRKVFGRFGFS